VIIMLLDHELFIFATCVLLNKKDSIQPIKLPDKPLYFNLLNCLLCGVFDSDFPYSLPLTNIIKTTNIIVAN